MTSIAFIAGVFPLVKSHGAGAEMRQAMGIAVFSGMIGVTLFGLFLTPVFYVTLMKLGFKKKITNAPEFKGTSIGPAAAGAVAALAFARWNPSGGRGTSDRRSGLQEADQFRPGEYKAAELGAWKEGRRSIPCQRATGGKFSMTRH